MLRQLFAKILRMLALAFPGLGTAAALDVTLATGQFGSWGAFAAEWRSHANPTRECYVLLNKHVQGATALILTSRVALDHPLPDVPRFMLSGSAPAGGPDFVEHTSDIAMIFDDGTEVPLEVVNRQVDQGVRYVDVAVVADHLAAAVLGVGQSARVRARDGNRVFFDEAVDGFAEAYAHIAPHCGWSAAHDS